MQLYPEPLSEREREVLRWLAAGASNREIGRQLYIAESTVKRHVYNIFGKLNVRNRTQAALRAREQFQRLEMGRLEVKIS